MTDDNLRRYWKATVDELRAYARRTAGRRILISSNGLLPYVDFNSVGMYPWNPDEQTPDYRGRPEGRVGGVRPGRGGVPAARRWSAAPRP